MDMFTCFYGKSIRNRQNLFAFRKFLSKQQQKKPFSFQVNLQIPKQNLMIKDRIIVYIKEKLLNLRTQIIINKNFFLLILIIQNHDRTVEYKSKLRSIKILCKLENSNYYKQEFLSTNFHN